MAKAETVDAETFRQCLKIMGWSYADAAKELGVHSRQRVADWARNRRRVPGYIVRAIGYRVDRELSKRGI